MGRTEEGFMKISTALGQIDEHQLFVPAEGAWA